MLVCIKGARALSTKLTSKRVKSDAVYFGHNYQMYNMSNIFSCLCNLAINLLKTVSANTNT